MDITYIPEGATDPVTVKATKDEYGNWSLPADSGLKIDPASGVVTIPADKVKDGTEVTATAKDEAGNTSDSAKATTKADAKTPDKTAPAALTVKANDDGSVEVTPPADADTKEVSVTYTPQGATEPKTVTATKGADGTWTLPKDAPEGVKVDPTSGKVTIPADKVADKTEVTATAKDEAGNTSDSAKATTKADAKTPDKTAPAAPTVKANDDGSVEVTPPADADTKEVSVTYTPQGATEPKTVTATKGADGKWSVPEGSDVTVDPDTGVITVPADKVKDGTEVSAKAKDKAGNESTPTDTSKATAKTPTTSGGSTGGSDSTGGTTTTPTVPTDGDKTGKGDKEPGKTDEKPDEKPGDKTGGKTDGKTDGKIKVKDVDNLTDEEKQKIIDKVKKDNPDAVDVKFDEKGNVVITDKNGLETSIPYKSLVSKVEEGSVSVPSKDKSNAQAPSKGKKQMNQEPSRNKRNQAGAKNVKTGVGSVSGLFGLAGAALAGLFATKKKEDEEEDK